MGLVLVAVFAASCGGGTDSRTPSRSQPAAPAQPKPLVRTPAFSGDSAYAHIAKQVTSASANTEGRRACADWLAQRLSNPVPM